LNYKNSLIIIKKFKFNNKLKLNNFYRINNKKLKKNKNSMNFKIQFRV